jgi:NADH-quinone oxidoreductase subunit B
MSTAFRIAEDPSVRVLVTDLGLACCAMEVESAVRLGLLLPDGDGPVDRTVLLVSGTVTEALAPAVRSAHDELDGPVRVLSFGSCASTGGPYWDAPTVVAGVDRVVPVSRYVPGCPPRPEALAAALLAEARGVPA